VQSSSQKLSPPTNQHQSFYKPDALPSPIKRTAGFSYLLPVHRECQHTVPPPPVTVWAPNLGSAYSQFWVGPGPNCSDQGDLVEAPAWTADWESVPVGRSYGLPTVLYCLVSEASLELLHCALSLAVQCIVIDPVCGFVRVSVCVGLLPR